MPRKLLRKSGQTFILTEPSMGWKLSNFVSSTLGQSALPSDTTIYIDDEEVDGLPTLGVGDKAKAVLFNATYREIVNITAWNTDGTLTVERAKESTTARHWEAGTKLIHTPTAEILQAVLDATVQSVYRGVATGTNAITVTTTGSTPTPSDGDEIMFEIAATNTDVVTVTYTNGTTTIGPKSLIHPDRTELRVGDLVSGFIAKIYYDASVDKFILISQTSKQFEISKINSGPLNGNLLPNGSFDAWNNNTVFATPVSGAETADNVVVSYDGTIGAFSVSRQAFTLGQTDVSGGPEYFLRWDQSSAGSASTFRKIRMKIPKVGKFAQEQLILSASVKADVGRNVTAKLIQFFGTGGVPSAEVVSATEVWAVTTSWTRFDISAILANVNGKTLGSNNDDGLVIEFSLPVNTSMTIDFAMAQVEFGDEATKPHARFPLRWDQGGTGGSFVDVDDFVAFIDDKINAAVLAFNLDLTAIEALAGTSGLLAKIAANTWALRSLAVGTGLSVSNPAGVAGDPTVSLGTALTNYNADPLSIAELASVTGAFGTAAFVADSGLVHIAGAETITGAKIFSTGSQTAITLDRSTNTVSNAVALLNTLRDSGNNITTYSTELTAIEDNTDGSEDGSYTVQVIRAGSLTSVLQISGLNSTASFLNGVVLFPNGSATNPAIAGVNDSNTGIYWDASDNIYLTTLGVVKWAALAGGAWQAQGDYPVRPGPGSASAPSFAHRTNTDTGMYFPTTDSVGWSINNSLKADIDASRLLMAAGMDIVLDSALGPSGVYSVGFRGAPLMGGAAVNAARTFSAQDMGKTAYHDEVTARTWTIDSNANYAAPIGSIIIIDNTGNSGAAGAITLQITTDTLRRGDGVSGTGTRTISANQVAIVRKTKSTEWVITGTFT